MLDNRRLSAELKEKSLELRVEIVRSLHRAGGGHYGGSLSVVDILLALFSQCRSALGGGNGIERRSDRIILSKGHAAIALYAVLKQIGVLQDYDLATYGGFNRGLEGHPDMTVTPGIDFSTGSLGQGISVGAGMALALKANGPHVWVVVGDGECQEGQVWEAAGLAARYRLSNLHVVIDLNGAQEVGWGMHPGVSQEPLPDAALKWQSFGWDVAEANGHSFAELLTSFTSMRGSHQPSVLIAHTVKGKGVSMFEMAPVRYHCANLSAVEYAEIMEELGVKENG